MNKTTTRPRRKLRNRAVAAVSTAGLLTATSFIPAFAADDRPWWHARSIGNWYLSLWGVN